MEQNSLLCRPQRTARERVTVAAARAPYLRRWSDGANSDVWSVPSIVVVNLLSLALVPALGDHAHV